MLKLALAIFLSLCGVANAQLAGGLQFPGPGTVHSTGGAFTPAALPNIYAWYEGNLDVYSNVGCTTPATALGAVACWKDQSGVSGVNLGVNSTGIVYNVTQLNSLATIDNNGAGSALFNTMSLGGTTVSVCVLANMTTTNFGRMAAYGVGGSDTGPTGFIAAFLNGSNTAPTAYNNGLLSTKAITASTWNQICSIWDGTNNTLYVSNVAGTPVASTPTFAASGTFLIFNAPGFGNEALGSIAGVVVVKGAMSGTDRTNLQSYWFAKWGVN